MHVCLRNPWHCSFHEERRSYFVCVNTSQDRYEEVDVITKSGNYGWPEYEGPLLYDTQQSATKNNTVDLYADLYAGNVWAAAETPKNSGKFSTTVPFSCAKDSPMNCSSVPKSRLAALGYIFSFGEDNNKDIYILRITGVYRIVPPSRCDFTCSKEVKTSALPNTPPSSSNAHQTTMQYMVLMVILSSMLVVLASIL